jgi:membrane associated rhomboid family serine protease
MAFRSNGPVMLALPPFRGMTRQIILIALGVFFGLGVLGLVLPPLAITITNLMLLVPDLAVHFEIWRFLSYPFIGSGLVSVAFALLSVWFFGSSVEDERGSRWLGEYFLVTTVAGGLLASILSLVLGLQNVVAGDLWPFVLAVLVAFAYFNPEQSVRFSFIFTLKAKYLAVIYVLVYLALALRGGDRFGAIVALMNAACGYAFLRFAPRRGLRAGASEQWFGLRNAYYRAKRRRAAKKFTVYMRKQGKDVSLDENGRYVDPSGTPRDPNDKRWMN